MDGHIWIVLMVAGVLLAVFLWGGIAVPSVPVEPIKLNFFGAPDSNSPNASLNDSNYSELINLSCFGYPDFVGSGAARQGQDCTGDGEFQDNYFCLNYPPEKAGDYAKNLSLYCSLDGGFKGECCV